MLLTCSRLSMQEKKHARMTVLIDPKSKKAFEKICLANALTSSHVVRELIQQYLESHAAGGSAQRKKAPTT